MKLFCVDSEKQRQSDCRDTEKVHADLWNQKSVRRMNTMNQINQRLCKKMENNELLFGTLATSGTPILTEALAQCGFDVLWLDMEHTGIGLESLINNMIAARSGGTVAWVRVPWNDPVLIKPVLDMGADGIIFPFIRTAEEAQLAVASCTFPPDGIRGYGPLRALDYGRISQETFVTHTFRDCQRIIQIEHIDAVHNLREIACVDGIDGFIVGPNDLSASIGRLGQLYCPEMIALYREIGAILRDAGKCAGIYVGALNPKNLTMWKAMGYRLFFSGSDCGYVYEGASKILQEFQAILK